ncbi:MAG: hypothetical protein PHI12_07730 [Dehalococcoidales bacterium]|nr:hypothetical protein [Dehalococcoidales bacterium]
MKVDDIPEWLIRAAGALGGDKIAFGFLFRKLRDEKVDAEAVRIQIQNNMALFVSNDVEWAKWQDLFARAGLGKFITKERFEQEFEKHMPDVCQCVRDEPGGIKWFENQILDLRIKLGVQIDPSHFRPIDKP